MNELLPMGDDYASRVARARRDTFGTDVYDTIHRCVRLLDDIRANMRTDSKQYDDLCLIAIALKREIAMHELNSDSRKDSP